MAKTQLKRWIVAAGVICAFILIASKFPTTSQAAQQGEKTIDETHKSIVALKGLPDSQLRPIMNYFNAALGVQCNFCHVRENNQMAFDKDHEHKTIAREMIKMVQEINKTSFNGRNTVTCFTCHQGKANPTAVPALPLPAPPAPPAPPAGMAPGAPGAPPAAPPAPPTTEQIWDKYISAIGGKDAVSRIKTRTLKGTYTSGNGMTSEFDVKMAATDKIAVTNKSERGESTTVIAGSTGWAKDQRGTRDLGGADIAAGKALAEVLDTVKIAEPLPKLDVIRRKMKIGDKDAWVLRGAVGQKRITLYFDAESGLLLRKVETLGTIVGAIPQQTDFDDYKDVDGVKLPMTIKMAGVEGGNTGVRKITEVKNNASIDPSAFSAPAK